MASNDNPMTALPTTNPFASTDTKVSYSSAIDVQMERDAHGVREREETDWDDETDIENDYE